MEQVHSCKEPVHTPAQEVAEGGRQAPAVGAPRNPIPGQGVQGRR
jgi:hypothetical protein